MAIIKIPDGNAFKLRVTAMVNDVPADLNVVNNIIVNFVRRGRIAQPFGIDGNGRLVIANDGSLARGLYGVELTGYHDGKPWRHYIKNAFKIVDENEDADTPTVVDDVPVYDISDNMSFGGDGVTAAYVDNAIAAHDEDGEAHEALQAKMAGKVDDVLVDGESVVDTDPVTGKRTVGFHKDQFGKVDDVKVNGESVLNENNEAEITVPTKTSELDNDAEFSTNDEVDEKVAAHMVNDVNVSVDNTAPTGQPSAEKTFQDGVLDITFKNVKGEKGDPLTWNDLTEPQKASLKGRPGADFQPIEDVSGLSIAHSLGNDEGKVMSQKGVTDAFDSELEDYTEHPLENIDDITVYDNKYYTIVNGGNEASSTMWKCIKFPVEVGRKYHVKGAAGQNARLWCLLNANDVKIDNSSDSSAVSLKEEDVKVTNANAAYMIVNTSKSTLASPIAKVYSLARSLKKTDNAEENSNLPITSKGVKRIFDNLSLKQIIRNINVPLSDRTITNGFFSNNGGPTTEEGGAGWTWTRISVNPGEEYTVTSGAGQLGRLWFVLNENDSIISRHSYSGTPIVQTDKVTIPPNGVYLIVNRKISLYGQPLITTEEIVTIDGIDDVPTENSGNLLLSGAVFAALRNIGGNKGNILYGKTLCVAGDSITYGADMDAEGYASEVDINFYQWNGGSFQQVTENARMSYGFQIAERNNMVFYNQGISGSTVQAITGKNGFSTENGRYTKLPDNIDYLVLFFGWNDAAYGTLGTIEDNDNQSYYGAYNVVLPYLIDKYPYTKICLVVPFGTTEGHRNAIRQLCNKWGVACFDFYGAGTPLYYGKEASVGVDASIVTANRAKFQANGAHPNHYGHKQLADMLEGFLRTI